MKKMRFVLYSLGLNEHKRNFKAAKLYNAFDHYRHTSLSQKSNFHNEIAEPTVPGDIIRAKPELTLKRLKPASDFAFTATKRSRATACSVRSNPR
jgi:hypothetical protein